MRDDDGTGSDPPGNPLSDRDTEAETAPASTPAQDSSRTEHRGGRTQSKPTSEQSTGDGWKVYLWDLLSSVAIVVLIGGLLFTASGIWPPMVAVESGSMEPVMERGDLAYVMEAERFPGPGAHGETGVVTAETARENGYRQFDGYGDVIVFKPGGSDAQTPIIHRAMLWVDEGERWVDRANPAYLGGADSCSDLPDDICPAAHAGFITKGDNNGGYDQVTSISRGEPIKPGWIIGTAEFHLPYLGQIRLSSAGALNESVAMNGSIAAVENTSVAPVENASVAG